MVENRTSEDEVLEASAESIVLWDVLAANLEDLLAGQQQCFKAVGHGMLNHLLEELIGQSKERHGGSCQESIVMKRSDGAGARRIRSSTTWLPAREVGKATEQGCRGNECLVCPALALTANFQR